MLNFIISKCGHIVLIWHRHKDVTNKVYLSCLENDLFYKKKMYMNHQVISIHGPLELIREKH